MSKELLTRKQRKDIINKFIDGKYSAKYEKILLLDDIRKNPFGKLQQYIKYMMIHRKQIDKDIKCILICFREIKRGYK